MKSAKKRSLILRLLVAQNNAIAFRRLSLFRAYDYGLNRIEKTSWDMINKIPARFSHYNF
ncbi:hypothetical protein [Evansella halocellulosilytica]|uniref:hypothetical protein n=1 Tax=Evansella halocellulosilytica TaxID=2011013 RepID=UPI0011560A15|nr:hypothetical protein [Evansella halocellulosilytica]